MAYFTRKIESSILTWRSASSRKPLLLRGARQVGKSSTVRQLGKEHFRRLVEFNFEKFPKLTAIFELDLDPRRIIRELEIQAGTPISIGNDLVFFDEIQECPKALTSLRYFYEEIPELHIVAAGSLLEFVLDQVSFPVGRIEHQYLYPMCFSEFLIATRRSGLAELLPRASESQFELPESAAIQLYQALSEYFVVGGMPQAVSEYVDSGSFLKAARVHDAIIQSLRDDVHKYMTGTLQLANLSQTMERVFRYTGQQLKYSTINPEDDFKRTKRSLEALERAMLISLVPSVNPSGLPLGAEASSKQFKSIFLDIGLGQRLAGLPVRDTTSTRDLLSTYDGRLAEQFVGQQLLSESTDASEGHRLFCWMRGEKSSTAEIDYVLVREGKVVPVEVKSGKSGRFKSLQIFLKQYPQSPRAICLQHRSRYEKHGLIEFWPLFTIL